MDPRAHRISAVPAALIGVAGLASAMGVGRFAFTPLLPLMQYVGGITLAQGGSLAAANYLGYLMGAVACTLLGPAPHRIARVGLVAVAVLTAGMGLSDTFGVWLALRFFAGVASAFVLVGVSAWVLPLLADQGRESWSGWVFAGVGIGIVVAGLVALAAGLLRKPPADAWLLLGTCSAVIAVAVWKPMVAGPAVASSRGWEGGALDAKSWRAVLSYGAFGFGYIVPATFLPAAARQLIADPAVFGWTWPMFGLAAAASTVASSRLWRDAAPWKLWASAQLVMSIGVLAPAIRMTISTLLFSAVCVGGTFMVVTMAGMQEARRVAGDSAPRLMAAMTAAFALGQLVGPFTVTLLRSSGSAAMAPSHIAASAVLLLGAFALVFGSHRDPAPRAIQNTKGMPYDDGA